MLRRRRYIIQDAAIDKGSQNLLNLVLTLMAQKNKLRSIKDINVKDLAAICGYSVSKARRWMLGEEVYESVSRLCFLAENLGVEPVLFFRVLTNQINAEKALEIANQSLKKQQAILAKMTPADIEEEPGVFVQHPTMTNPIRQRLRNKVARVMVLGHRTADDYFDTIEVSLLFGVSQRTVQWWLDTKKLNADRTSGGHARIRYSQIVDFINERGAFSPFEDFINKRILFIDEEGRLNARRKVFKDWRGYDTHFEDNPDKALDMINKLNPEFVVIASDLKGIEINSILNMLRKVKSSNLQGFIVLKNKIDKTKYLRMGANMIIYRPFKPEDVKEAIERIEAEQLSNP